MDGLFEVEKAFAIFLPLCGLCWRGGDCLSASACAMAGESFTDLEQGKDEQVVTPWEVRASEGGRINYSKVVEEFGCSLMTQRLIDRVESATGTRAHHMLRRGIFFAHRCAFIPPLSHL